MSETPTPPSDEVARQTLRADLVAMASGWELIASQHADVPELAALAQASIDLIERLDAGEDPVEIVKGHMADRPLYGPETLAALARIT